MIFNGTPGNDTFFGTAQDDEDQRQLGGEDFIDGGRATIASMAATTRTGWKAATAATSSMPARPRS